jgi:glycosyltransferase involved in cell wall biosynthesis
MRLPSIHYVSHHWPSGYGASGRRLFRALADLGVPLRWTPIEFDEDGPLLPPDVPSELDLDRFRTVALDPDVVVLHCVPELLPTLRHLRPAGAALILHTVWEHEVLQPHWPALLNQFDGVIVPTEWNAESFRRADVHVPVEVVPHVASTESPDASWLEAPPVVAGDAFLIHSIAVWSLRKTPWRALEAYARAFGPSDHTLMVLRTSQQLDRDVVGPPGPPDLERHSSWSAAEVMHRYHPAPRLHLATDIRSFAEIEGLHHRSGCWLSLPRAEGWDLGAFDAATAGTPVITTGHGGQLAYLDPDASILIGGKPVELNWLPGATWIEPDMDAAVEALRVVRHDAGGVVARAREQGERLRRTYSPDTVGRQFLAALERMGTI